jgi:STE24 endopeptidase
MSETIATFMSTLSAVSDPDRHGSRVLGAILLAVAAGEAGARALMPRAAPIEPAPVDVHDYFTDEEIERGRRYARPQLALGMAKAAVELVALGAVVRRRPAALRRLSRRPVAGGALGGVALAVALSLPPLPLAAVSRRRALRVGLATQSWRDWAVDLVKATGIETVLTAGGAAAAIALMRRYPRNWWLPAATGGIGVGAVLGALAPVVLDPIFNDFTPLPEGETRADVLALANEAGVRVREVFSVDASRRTTAANAYVTGLGPTKRVVLFDTLLDRYNRDEVRLVVAHELAHVRHRDVQRGFLYAAVVAPAATLAVQRVSWGLSDERASAAALPALALGAALVALPLGFSSKRLSRALERRADEFALRLAGAPDAFVSFERTIALQNVADVQPPRWVNALLATHPPTAERIGAAVAFAQQA